MTVKFPEFSFADVHNEPLYKHSGGRFREVNGQLFISVFSAEFEKHRNKPRLLSERFGIEFEVSVESVFLGLSRRHTGSSPRYRSARQRNSAMNL
jgi:hypothetical protein